MSKGIRKAEEILDDGIKMELAKKVLETALHSVDGHVSRKDVSLRKEIEERLNRKKEEERKAALVRKIIGGSLLALVGGFFVKGIVDEVKDKRETEEAIRQEEQKELYRKLSNIKGRV